MISFDFTFMGKEYGVSVVVESYKDEDWYIESIEEYSQDERTPDRSLDGKELDDLCEQLEMDNAFIDRVNEAYLNSIVDRPTKMVTMPDGSTEYF